MLPSNSNKKKPYTPSTKIVLTPAQKAAIAQAAGFGKSDGIPASLRARTPKGTSANTVGLGSRSPLTRTAGRVPNKAQVETTGKAFIGYDKNNTALQNAAFAAMALLPIPGLKGAGAVARAGKVATTAGKAGKVAKPAANAGDTAGTANKLSRLTKAEIAELERSRELAQIKRLMQPEPRPAREVVKFSQKDQVRMAMRGKSGKVMTTGPKPVRTKFKTDAAFKTALKKWENALEANRAAARAGGDSLPVAKKTSPPVKRPSAKKDVAPVAKKETPATPAVKPSKVKKPSAKSINPAKSLAARDTKPGTALVVRPGSAVATRPGKPVATSAAGKAVSTERGVPTFAYNIPRGSAGRGRPQLAIEGPKTAAKGAAAPKKPLALAAGKAAKKRKFPKKTLLGAAGLTAGLWAAGDVLDRTSKKETAAATTTSKATGRDAMGMNAAERAAYRTKNGLLDKYGRKISRAEFNRREAYRARKAGMSAKELAAAEKKELARRKGYRETKAVKRFGKEAATRKTRKARSTYLDDRARAYLK